MRHVFPQPISGAAEAPHPLPRSGSGGGEILAPKPASPISDLLTIACASLNTTAALLWHPEDPTIRAAFGPVERLGLRDLAAKLAALPDNLRIAQGATAVHALVPSSPARFLAERRIDVGPGSSAVLCLASETALAFGTAEIARLGVFAQTFAALLRDQDRGRIEALAPRDARPLPDAPSRTGRAAALPRVSDAAGIAAVSQRLQWLETTDVLTGLMNRATLTTLLQRRGAGRRSALIMLDLDEFGAINEAFGYGMGDACLKRVAARIARNCRGADAVARLGGDEFAILLGDIADVKAVEKVASRLLTAIRKPLRCKGQVFRLGASIGVAICEAFLPASEIPNLFSNASMALHSAKQGGGNNFRFFDEDMRRVVYRRFTSVRNIAIALEAGELELFYQPKVRLRDGGHAGFEALLRWRKPDGTVLAPGEFEDALNDAELSRKIGDFVIESAINQARKWHLSRQPFGHIAINLSSSQFREARFAERLLAMMEASGLRPSMLEVEVTEGVFLTQSPGVVQHALETLMHRGVRIALDDFGTGFASLTHLRRFPVHTIKIDRSFVSRLLSHDEDHSIVQAIIFLARNLNLDVVAEGIERESERDFLRALGCDIGQGYFFGRPVSAAETSRLMAEPVEPRRLAPGLIPGRSVVQLR